MVRPSVNLLTYRPEAWPLFERAMGHIFPVDTVLDVGPGIRPQRIVPCARHICLEPHHEYRDVLAGSGFQIIDKSAPEGLSEVQEPIDTVVMLDVIEHMERMDGFDTIRTAQRIARKQVIVFTPLGFLPQEETGPADAWGLQGQHWQRHRSGWIPEDFPGWKVEVDERFHGADSGAFFAIWTAP